MQPLHWCSKCVFVVGVASDDVANKRSKFGSTGEAQDTSFMQCSKGKWYNAATVSLSRVP